MNEPNTPTSDDPVSAATSRAWVVAPRGDLDIGSAGQLDDELGVVIEQGASIVVLDLADVHFLDSSGLRVILRRARELEDQGGRLLLEHASAATERVLEITGTLEHLRGEPAPADAPR